MSTPRVASDVAFTAITMLAAACGSFGEGRTAQPTPPVSDDGGSDADFSADAEADAAPQLCPTNALACHFFEGALAEAPWGPGGQNTGLLAIRRNDTRSFLRAGAERAPAAAGPFAEYLQVVLAPQSAISVSFELRVDTIDPMQSLELVTVTYFVRSGVYRFTHLALGGRQPKIAEFAEPSNAASLVGATSTLPSAWRRVEFIVDHDRATSTLAIDGLPTVSGPLTLTPAEAATECHVTIGFNHTKTWNGPIAVDFDSVVVKALP